MARHLLIMFLTIGDPSSDAVITGIGHAVAADTADSIDVAMVWFSAWVSSSDDAVLAADTTVAAMVTLITVSTVSSIAMSFLNLVMIVSS